MLYRAELKLTAPLGTPLVGPTLFGRLCWLIREREGEEALIAWLEDAEQCWSLSDGFPGGCLPKPLARPRPLGGRDLAEVKRIKKMPFVTRAAWLRLRDGWSEAQLGEGDLQHDRALPRRLAHNQVHRSGRGTLDEGGFYVLDEDWRFAAVGEADRNPARVDLYVETNEPRERVATLLADLGEAGYGRDASTGRGRWQVLAVQEDRELAAHDGSRRMSLSRGVIDAQTMCAPLWRLEPHFGRTGPQLSLAGVSPFKRPVLLTRPGATFTPGGPGPFGRMLDGLHPARPEIRLNARHIAIPFTEAEEDCP